MARPLSATPTCSASRPATGFCRSKNFWNCFKCYVLFQTYLPQAAPPGLHPGKTFFPLPAAHFMVNQTSCTKCMFDFHIVHIIHILSPILWISFAHPIFPFFRENGVLHRLIHIIHNLRLFTKPLVHRRRFDLFFVQIS